MRNGDPDRGGIDPNRCFNARHGTAAMKAAEIPAIHDLEITASRRMCAWVVEQKRSNVHITSYLSLLVSIRAAFTMSICKRGALFSSRSVRLIPAASVSMAIARWWACRSRPSSKPSAACRLMKPQLTQRQTALRDPGDRPKNGDVPHRVKNEMVRKENFNAAVLPRVRRPMALDSRRMRLRV